MKIRTVIFVLVVAAFLFGRRYDKLVEDIKYWWEWEVKMRYNWEC